MRNVAATGCDVGWQCIVRAMFPPATAITSLVGVIAGRVGIGLERHWSHSGFFGSNRSCELLVDHR